MSLCASAAGEPVFVQAFVTKLPVETFDKGVLDWFAWPNEARLHPARVGPCIERAPAEFWTVVHHDRVRQTRRVEEPLQHAHDAQARQRTVDFNRHTFAGEVVDDVQRRKPRLSASVSTV